jgi:ornithine cyclodeaminase
MGDFHVISTEQAGKVLTWDLAIDSVRKALESVAADDSILFPVQIMRGTAESDIFAVKAGVEKKLGLVGFKFGGYWPGNAKSGLPPHSSSTILLDSVTGYPRALLSGRIVNLYRTAAADAVAVQSLARGNASVLGVVGGGHQAEFEIRAICHVRHVSLIKIHTRSRERGEWITARLKDLDVEIRLTDAETAVRNSDIVVTVTPSREPIVRAEWVSDGTHISAMGADTKGKQELFTDLVARSRLFADHVPQSVAIGEFQHVCDSKVIAAEDICPIGDVTRGKTVGRRSESDTTIFDSSGIAIQDLAIAAAILERAIALGMTTPIDF